MRGGPAQIRGCRGLLTPGQGLPGAAVHGCLSRAPGGQAPAPGPCSQAADSPGHSTGTLADPGDDGPGLWWPQAALPHPGDRHGSRGGQREQDRRAQCAAENTGAQRLLAQGHRAAEACSGALTACSARPCALDAGPHCTQAPCPPYQQPMLGLPSLGTLRLGTGQRGGEAGWGPAPCCAPLVGCQASADPGAARLGGDVDVPGGPAV